MRVELGELYAFAVLAAELHFGKASEQLFVSQPALSKQIRRLEEKVGGSLFVRTRRKVGLTEAGRVLLPLAQRLLQDSEAAVRSARLAAEGRAGTLRIGFGIASVSEILPRAILGFRRSYPNVELQMRDMSTPAQISALIAGGIDLGIVRLPVGRAELASFFLFRERLVAVTPRSVPYKSVQGLQSLRDRPFITFPRSVSATFHDHVWDVCRSAGFVPKVVQEANETFTILNLVRAGLGVSLVPSSARRMRVPAVNFHELTMPEARWRIGIAWHRASEKRELISRFCEVIRAVVSKKIESA